MCTIFYVLISDRKGETHLLFQGKAKPSVIEEKTEELLTRILNYHMLLAIAKIILLIYFTVS